MDKNYSYALSFVSADSKGIVSSVTKVLFNNGFNIADSSSTLLQGVFSMIFIVTSDKDIDENTVRNMFTQTKFVPNVFKFTGEIKQPEGNHYSISVYGADKPGIVNGITSVLAEHGINIVDLQTKVTGRHASKVYIMLLEVAVPENLYEFTWIEALSLTAKQIGTDVTCKKIESYEF